MRKSIIFISLALCIAILTSCRSNSADGTETPSTEIVITEPTVEVFDTTETQSDANIEVTSSAATTTDVTTETTVHETYKAETSETTTASQTVNTDPTVNEPEITTSVTSVTTAEIIPAELAYITETVTFDGIERFYGTYVSGNGSYDGNATLTYTYREGFNPSAVKLYGIEIGGDFAENGYYEEMQTHNGWRPEWATVTKRSILRRNSGDILIEYVDGENNGPVIVFVRVSDKYMVSFCFEGRFVDETIIEELASTFVFEDIYEHYGEEWTFTYDTPNYDEWKEAEGEYVIWEFTKNTGGEFELTYSEGDVLCIPYVTIGADKIVYATQKTIIPPADEIGKPHTLKAHEKIRSLFQHDSEGGRLSSTNEDPDSNGVYADEFIRYCMNSRINADILRERAGILREVLRVYYNGEQVDGIGVVLPDYYFIKEHAYEWQFVFSKPYAKEEVNTVRIELQIPNDLQGIYPETSLLLDLGAKSLDDIENCTLIHENMAVVKEKTEEIDGKILLPDYDFESNIEITDHEDLKMLECYSYIEKYSGGNIDLQIWPDVKRITLSVDGRKYRLFLMQDGSIISNTLDKELCVYQAEEQYMITDEVFKNWILKYDENASWVG